MPEQLAAKADPISISKHPAIQAVLHPQPGDDLLPLRPRGHARRVILRRRTKSEPRPPSKLAKRQRNQFANQTHVDAVPHDHMCAPVARRPGVGAAAPHHLRPVLHTERRTPSELISQIVANRSQTGAAKAKCGDEARGATHAPGTRHPC